MVFDAVRLPAGVSRGLIVVAHPAQPSLSHSIANRIADELRRRGVEVDIADLHLEGFAPAMTTDDVLLYRGIGAVSPDILREQERIDRSDLLVIVFPVYWWSLPALLKGWIERVFTGGWAYRENSSGKIEGIMRKIPVRLIATAATGAESYGRHGYTQAIQTQVVEGIFNYCGLPDTELSVLFEADTTEPGGFAQFLGEL